MTVDDGTQASRKEPALAGGTKLIVFPAEEAPGEDGAAERSTPMSDEGPTLVQVQVFRAVCSRTDHDPALGGFLSWGGWWGPEHFADSGPAEDQARADGDAHFVQTGHTEAEVGFRLIDIWVVPVPTGPEPPLETLPPPV